MKLRYLFLCGFLASISCATVKKPCTKITDQASPEIPGDFHDKPYSIAADGNLRIKFNPNLLPEKAVTLEIIYNGKYLGFYDVKDLIFLPRYEGQSVPLVATFSDVDGNKLVIKTYYIQI